MSEWLIRCTDDLQSGVYYASVDVHDGEQPILVLFKKDGEKTIVVGQGELMQPHGRLIDADVLAEKHRKLACELWGANYDFHIGARSWVNSAPAVIPASE